MNPSKHIWNTFVQLPGASVDGNVGIASQCAIEGVIDVMKRKKPERILELGSGIGTMTWTVLDSWQALYPGEPYPRFYSVENNAYCLSQLENNLAPYLERVQIIPSPDHIPESDHEFDFVLIDGGGNLGGDMGEMPLCGLLNEHAVVLIEGSRKYQRDILLDLYGYRKYTYVKMDPSVPYLHSPCCDALVKNKAFHLYMFEPMPDMSSYFTRKAAQRHFIYRVKRFLQT